MIKIKYKSGASSLFFQSLDKELGQLISSTDILQRAKRKLWIKMIFYFLLHISSYLVLFLIGHERMEGLVLTYIFIGLSGLLLGFNVSHDALHETFSKNKKVNHWLYHFSFNIQGTNAYLWKIRHRSSHHIFPNVDGCDADIDDNPFIRLSPQHRLRKYQRYQHLYSFFVYCFYTIHWFFFKDGLYLFKKNVANLQNKKNSKRNAVILHLEINLPLHPSGIAGIGRIFFWRYSFMFFHHACSELNRFYSFSHRHAFMHGNAFS